MKLCATCVNVGCCVSLSIMFCVLTMKLSRCRPCVFVPLQPKCMCLALRSPNVMACLYESDCLRRFVLNCDALCREFNGGA